jgi:hypothetical protein
MARAAPVKALARTSGRSEIVLCIPWQRVAAHALTPAAARVLIPPGWDRGLLKAVSEHLVMAWRAQCLLYTHSPGCATPRRRGARLSPDLSPDLFPLSPTTLILPADIGVSRAASDAGDRVSRRGVGRHGGICREGQELAFGEICAHGRICRAGQESTLGEVCHHGDICGEGQEFERAKPTRGSAGQSPLHELRVAGSSSLRDQTETLAVKFAVMHNRRRP